jgi:hypothetical protein
MNKRASTHAAIDDPRRRGIAVACAGFLTFRYQILQSHAFAARTMRRYPNL